MRALLTNSPGGWNSTQIAEVALEPGQGDHVLVAIKAVGLNPADAFQIDGKYPGGPKPPFVVGRDAAGVVLQDDPAGIWKAGDQVVVLQSSTTNLRDGTLCEQRGIAAENLARLPQGWSFVEGAAAPLVYLTAWKCLNGPAPLNSDHWVLVTGASGGVGLAAVQLAAAAGAQVVALSRSEFKRRRLTGEGAQFTFAPDDPQLKEKIGAATGRKGIGVVVETVGGPSVTQAVHLLGTYGRISLVGVLAGVDASISIPALMFKRVSLHGILVSDDDPATAHKSWAQIVALLEKSGRKPIVDRVFPFEHTRQAFDHLRGDVFGKVVVEVSK
jgi:NADPH2:quinone reductase